METKKSKTGLHVFVGILLGIIICVGVVFASYSLGYLTFDAQEENTEVETNNESNNDTPEGTNNNSLDFDISKVVNCNADSYTLANYSGTINITLDDSGTIATLSYNRAILSNTYALNWDLTGVEEGVYENQTANFAQKVKDVFFGGIGQDSTGDIILFLMEDGTVSYIPVYQTLSVSGVEGFATYQTFPELVDIVKFYTVNAQSSTGGSVTIFAQTKDGTLYDLAPMINNTSNNQ